MEKHHKTVGRFEFPEEIIHQIQSFMGEREAARTTQSFMGEREAARTTLVSKSWYGAWCTRPNLSFDQYELGKRFRQYATKTLQRYENLNLKIKTFLLRMYDDDSLARELILKAIKLGAIDLTIQVKTWPEFVLPDEVLESQTLATLSVEFVKVDLERRNKPLTSSNLKSLTLHCTVTKGDFSYLSRRFPLLESLQLKDLNIKDSLSKSDLSLQFPCLKTLVISDCHFKGNGDDVIRIRSPSLECLTISFRWFRKAKLEFDVPNIRKFMFKGFDVPLLELKTSSREWESDISINCTSCIGRVLCMRSLKQFVKQLSPSRVSLALHTMQPPVGCEDGFVGDGLAIPAVENLTISGYDVSPAFLNALFWSCCRPNFVNIQRRCIRGIEKENVEQFQRLRSLPWNTLLDDSTNHSEEEFVRFQLK